MCEESLQSEKQVEHELDRDKFSVHTSFITKKSFLQYIKGYPRKEYNPSWPKLNQCVYAKASAYYSYLEDTNPFVRLPSSSESRRYGNVKPHFEPPAEPYAIRDPYLEIKARKKYLESSPTCFVVLGKPDLNSAKLASMIANSWNCILISPLILINEEIQRATEKGKILEKILKTGEHLGPEIIMNLIVNRVNKRDVFHRGYVVEGLPLIPNEDLDYSTYLPNVNKESQENLAQFFDSSFHRICTAVHEADEADNILHCNTHDTSFPAGQKSDIKGCIMKNLHEHFIPSQIEEMFATWTMKPSIIIYVMCPDADAVKKREHFRIDPITGHTVDTSLVGMSNNIEVLFSHEKTQNDVNISFDLYQELMNEERILDEYEKKYLLKRLCDCKSNVIAQSTLYKHFAKPVIEKWVLLHNPQYVLRVDGRTPASLMLQIVISRLRTLSISSVILPKKFLDDTTLEIGGESSVKILATDEFEGKSNEEAFEELVNRETVSPLYSWKLSSWKFICPVLLAKGRTMEGLPKYAIRFMNNIFFLSSEDAVDLFVANPRTFLTSLIPKPTCKVAVFGPRYSGKSELCRNLAQVLGGTIIHVGDSEKDLANVASNVSIRSFENMDLQEETNAIVKNIEGVPKEEIDVGIWRDGGYIVDGIHANIDCWKAIVEDSKIIFEDVILLYDEDPYDYLLEKWHNIQRSKHSGEHEEECMESVEFAGEQEDDNEMMNLIKYIRHIQKFELNWSLIKEEVLESCRYFISCDVGKIKNVSEYVIGQINDRYEKKARVMSEAEMEKERDLADYITMTDTEIADEEEGAEGEGVTVDLDFRERNRCFGDTNYYCPVALLKYNILRKGKEDFTSTFMDKIYLSLNAEALEEFIRDPKKLGLPLQKPLSSIPPVRVSIIGPPGCGKSTLANAISREYGLVHVDYFYCLTTFMKTRGMPEITRNDVIVAPEDLFNTELPELPQDLEDERYNTDPITVQSFIRQYWNTGNTLPSKMHRECLLQFFEGLYSQNGIVFEQYPSCMQDIDTALKNYTLPEIVIELRCEKETAVERMMPHLMKSWQTKLDMKRYLEQLRYENELQKYVERRENWVQQMMSEKSFRRQNEEEDGEAVYTFESEDDIFSGEYASSDNIDSEEVDLRRYNLLEQWVQENPEPILFTDWEEFESAKRRIEQGFENMYNNELQKLEVIKDVLKNEPMSYVVINAETNIKDVLLRVMRILHPYVCRNSSTLERTYTIDLETAEVLLNCGYFLLSSFGHWCPVQLHQNKIPLQLFLPQEAKQEICPVIHRQFIYFTGGKDAQSEFIKNPFKYIEQDSCAPSVPFRLSIIGPPKCGKTRLARRLAKEYGVRVITRGAALRHVIKYFPWTECAQGAEYRLRAGHTVPEEFVRRAIEMYSIDPNAVSQGFVLDGFPSNRKEYENLLLLGLQPMIILDLKSNLMSCLECLSHDTDETKKPPNFSNSFLKHRYAIWEIDEESFRDWLKKFTQNVVEIDATKSKWYVWSRTEKEVCSRYMAIRSYFRECDYDKVHRLKYMSISPYEFKMRQSRFESYCPLCLYKQDVMKISASTVDHQGMVQYEEYFYWLCPEHLDSFIQDPKKHLPPINTAYLQKERPRTVTEKIDLEHPCWFRRLQVKGFCLVTYVDNLPNRRLVSGKSTIGVLFKDNLYLFCTEKCRDKFLAQPDKYATIKIKLLCPPLAVSIQNLPNLGFLEQTVTKLVIKALSQISVNRPKIPGLSPSVTAAIYIGVYLKVHNTTCALEEMMIYKKVSERIRSREMIIKISIRAMKKRVNPCVHIPVYRNYHKPSYRLSGQISMISQIFSGQSNSVVFRRTSPTQVLVDPDIESDD